MPRRPPGCSRYVHRASRYADRMGRHVRTMTLPVLLVLGLVGVLGVPVAHADGPGARTSTVEHHPWAGGTGRHAGGEALAASAGTRAGTVTSGLPDGPGPQDAQAARRPVLLLGTSNLTWQHLVAAADDPSRAGSLASRLVLPASQMSPVNLVTRTAGDRTCTADGWLSLGSGSRAKATTGPCVVSGRPQSPTWDQARTVSADLTPSARPGSLADALATAGVSTAAVGDGAVLALTASDGTAPPTLPGLEALEQSGRLPDLTMVDLDSGQESPRDTYQQLNEIDDVLSWVEKVPGGVRVIVASVADGEDPGPQLGILPAGTTSPQGSVKQGWTTIVTGPATHRPGLVELPEITTALAAALGAAPDRSWSGSAPLVLPSHGLVLGDTMSVTPLEYLADDALHARASAAATVPAGLLLVCVMLGVGATAALSLRRRPHDIPGPHPGTAPPQPGPARPAPPAQPTGRWHGTGGGGRPGAGRAAGPGDAPRLRRRLACAALGAASMPLVLLVLNAFPWWRIGAAAGHPSAWTVLAVLGTAAALAAGASLLAAVVLPPTGRGRPPVPSPDRPPLPYADVYGVAGRSTGAREAVGPRPTAVTGCADDRGPAVRVGARRRATSCWAVPVLALLTCAAWLVDAALGAHLAFNGPLGMNAVVAGRFYGISNTAFALVAASLVVGIGTSWRALTGPDGAPGAQAAAPAGGAPTGDVDAAPAPAGGRRTGRQPGPPGSGTPPTGGRATSPGYLGRRRASWLLVAVLGGAALLLDGAPQVGADMGGAITLVPTLVVLGTGLAGTRLAWPRLLATVALTVGVVGGFAAWDYSRPSPERTHLGRFVQQVVDGSAWHTLARKAWALVAPFVTSAMALTALVVGLAVLGGALWWARRELRAWQEGRSAYAWLAGEQPGAAAPPDPAVPAPKASLPVVLPVATWLRAVLRALGVLVVVSVLVNDSGAAMAWYCLAVAVPLGLAALLTGCRPGDRAPTAS